MNPQKGRPNPLALFRHMMLTALFTQLSPSRKPVIRESE
jgi:hypothetical protein